MKKVDYKKLALFGITGGLMMASQLVAANLPEGKFGGSGIVLAGGCGEGKCGGFNPKRNANTDENPNAPATTTNPSPTSAPQLPQSLPNQRGELADNAGMKTSLPSDTKGAMTESDLLKSINHESRDIYNSLSPEGKALALQLANQACKGQNTCKGLNSCKTSHNSCAGKSGCKGQSDCAFKDKNKAVKVAAMKMAAKRANISN